MGMPIDGAAWDRPSVWASQMTARRVLEVVVPVFEKAGIEVLAVKGVVTAYLLYADPTDRPLGDVDVRIRPRDLERAAAVARAEGWRLVEWKPAYGAFVFFVGSFGLSVDVETGVGPPGLCALSVDRMMARATRGVGGLDVRVPEVHDLAVLLCINLFKDKIAKAFPWSFEDVRRVADAKGFEVGTFLERVREAKIATIAWIVADAVVRAGPSERWREIQERLGGDRAPRPIYAQMYRRLSETRPMGTGIRVLARVGADDWRMWPRALFWAAVWEAGLGGSK